MVKEILQSLCVGELERALWSRAYRGVWEGLESVQCAGARV